MTSPSARPPLAALGTREVVAAWLPLALSWAMMGVEQPAIAAVISRLPDPTLSLAAYGGVVYPLALVIEAPVIMLLSASTELSRDRASYQSLQRFTHRMGAGLTVLHLLLVATPLYEILVSWAFAVPRLVADEARWGLALMLPWSWAIGWRRHGQGVLIRYGRARWVGLGTLFRVTVTGLGLLIGAVWTGASGVSVGASALSLGVVAEGLFVAWAVRPVLREQLASDRRDVVPLEGRAFWAFYLPLASMPLVSLIIQPIGTAAVTRMPGVLDSLAVWPVVTSLYFFLQAPGLALAEVVVAQLGLPGGRAALRRFVSVLLGASLIVPLVVLVTPLGDLWFRNVIGLPGSLADLALHAFAIGIAIPVCRVLQSWYQGQLVAARQTRGVSEAVAVFGLTCVVVLGIGVWKGAWIGLTVATAGFALGRMIQTVWIATRARMARSEPSARSAPAPRGP